MFFVVKYEMFAIDVIFLATLIINLHFSLAHDIIVSLPNGKLKGKIEMTKTNYTFNSFSGVRYAQPPVRNLRFKSPVPVKPWTDIYDATYEKNICYQVLKTNHLESEDCLFLNIYSPNISNGTFPVMVFFHGGGFVIGSGGRTFRYGPDFFMEYDVVLVTMNYRLGAFGFSSTNDMVIPGNAGLKDQLLALKWIQQNIRYFGGDATKVTIFGESAGGASVAYHLLNHKSSGLFRAAILESGSALSAWAYQPDQRKYTFKTASFIDPNFKSNSSEDLLAFLLNASACDIHAASKMVHALQTPGNTQLYQGFYYAPVIEPDHNDAFLTKSMYKSFKNGDINIVPTIIGMNAEEGLMEYTSSFPMTVDAYTNDGALLLPKNMHIDDNNPNKTIVIKAIQDFYGISKDKPYEEQIAGTIRYLSDQCFARSIIKQAELQSHFSDVYFYLFSYDGEMGDINEKVAGTGNVSHMEELYYLFSRTLKTSNKSSVDLELFSESDRITHYRLMRLWVNFASTLNPTPDFDDLLQNIIWPKLKYSNEVLNYLDINKNLSVKSNPRWDAYTLWNDLYSNYAVAPLDGF